VDELRSCHSYLLHTPYCKHTRETLGRGPINDQC
jgi:hypothetical protein